MTDAQTGKEPHAARLAIEIVGAVAGLATFLTALLYYFGWTRTAALYRYFGVTQDLLNFSTSDYLLRSVNSAIQPFGVALGLTAAAIPAYRWATAGPRAEKVLRALRYVSWTLVVLGVMLIVTGWAIGPLVLFVALIMALVQPGTYTAGTLPRLALAALAIFMCFWAVAAYANYRGSRDAARLIRDPTLLPMATVYSADDLSLTRAKITPLPSSTALYKYRYDGLRILVRTGGRYVLLFEGWQPGQPIIVLQENDKLRFEYSKRL